MPEMIRIHEMKEAKQSTVWSAAPTPFWADGKLDVASIVRLVAQHFDLGVSGLLLAGTCGEGPFMTNGQRAELIRQVRLLAGNRLTLAAQVSDTSAARVCENMAAAADAGADFVVIAPPWLDRFANRDFIRRYFLEPIEQADLPVGIYVLKTPSGSPLDARLWAELAGHPRVKLLKDSSSSAAYARTFGAIRAGRPDLMLLTGDEFDVRTGMAAGYDGVLMGTGILNAEFIRRSLRALRDGDAAGAAEWQERSNVFLRDLFGDDIRCWLGGLKYALCHLGIFSSESMHLSFPLTAADRTRIEAALERERAFIHPGSAAENPAP